MTELLAQFVTEARDLLQEAGEDLMALERAPDDDRAIYRLFRSVHTLKGSSGLFDAKPLTQVLHAAEDIFQAVREHELVLSPDLADRALKALDQIGLWIERLDQHETLSDDAASIAAALVVELRGQSGRGSGNSLAAPNVDAPQLATVSPIDLRRWFSEEALVAAAAVAAGDGAIKLVSYRPEENCFFQGNDPVHLALQIPGLQTFGVEAHTPWGALSALDPFACNVAFHALSTAVRAEIDELFRYVPEQVTITELAASVLFGSTAPAKTRAALPVVVQTLLAEQIDVLNQEAPAEEFTGRVASAARVAANALRFGERLDLAAVVEAACAQALATGSSEGLSAAIDGALKTELAPTQDPEHPTALRATDRPAAAEAAERPAPRTLRVEQEKIDALMTMVGELVVAKNSLPFLARRAEHHFGERELSREIKDQYGVIDRIAQELQGAVMAIRMMPVGQVFQRFPRLVRDLSRKLGKEVELVVLGEETEADKNVIESLFNPLLHMVRNSSITGSRRPRSGRRAGSRAPRWSS